MIDGTGMCGGCGVMIGDIMTGSATVMLAMGARRRAAKSSRVRGTSQALLTGRPSRGEG